MILAPNLNDKIMQFAKDISYSVADNAPTTFAELVSRPTNSVVVWSGGSENTIYGSAEVNYAFRAWHDSLHRKLGADFTLHGETTVAMEQIRLLNDDTLATIIIAEVIGQADYFFKTGIFPVNQVQFILNQLNK